MNTRSPGWTCSEPSSVSAARMLAYVAGCSAIAISCCVPGSGDASRRMRAGGIASRSSSSTRWTASMSLTQPSSARPG